MAPSTLFSEDEMSLLTIKQLAIQRSGRFDLVVDTTSYVDNGIVAFVNAAQRWLDRKVVTPKEMARFQKDVVAGEFQATVQDCRAIKEVWMVSDAEKERLQLQKIDLKELRAYYSTLPMASQDRGSPLYYAPSVIGLAPSQAALTASTYGTTFTYDWEDIYFKVASPASEHYAYGGVAWYPPADGKYTLEVWGSFYSKALAADADINFWTEVHPDILVDATQMMIDASMRNTEGVNDWQKLIEMKTVGIGGDVADEESSDVLDMEPE